MNKSEICQIYRAEPVVQTQHLTLRPLTMGDRDDLYEMSHPPQVSKFVMWDPHPNKRYTKRCLANLIASFRNHTYWEWAVVEKASGKMIGTCGFTAFRYADGVGEIGYSFNPDFWGRGYATEAVEATLRFGFDVLGLKEIEALCAIENVASENVLSRVGMLSDTDTRMLLIKGKGMEVRRHSILREAYKNK